MSNREKEEITAKLMQAERMLSESKHSIQKLEEENSKLRRALEQSMMRLNRMSLDSDNYVDRLLLWPCFLVICIKSLLVNTPVFCWLK